MENWSRAGVTNIGRGPNVVGFTPLVHGRSSAHVASHTLEHCDIKPVKDQVFEPILVYKKKQIDTSSRPSTKASSGGQSRSKSKSERRRPNSARKVQKERSQSASKFHEKCHDKPHNIQRNNFNKVVKKLDYRKYADNIEPVVNKDRVSSFEIYLSIF